MDKPLISVCIPTYNGAKYLRECIDSVLAQTFTEFEVLVVDDCSSDETVHIIQEYATQDSRIRLIVNEHNLGLVGNWNKCVELAQGEWIKFVFQDDLIEPDCLKQMLAFSQARIPIIASRRRYVFEAEITNDTRKKYKNVESFSINFLVPGLTEISAKNFCEATLDHLGTNFVGEPVALMLHRSIFYRFGIFNPYLTHFCDIELWTRVAINTGISYIPETLAKFRVHNSSLSSRHLTTQKYRGLLLDRLILLHDFVFSPFYAPLRKVACHRSQVGQENYWKSDNLVNLLKKQAYRTRRIAECAVTDNLEPDFSLLKEWQGIIELYPNIFTMSQCNLAKRLVVHSLYRWKQLYKLMKKQMK